MESATSQSSTASCELTPYSPVWNKELVSVHFDLAHVPSESDVKYNLNELCEVSNEAGCSAFVVYDWINKLVNLEGLNVSCKNQIVKAFKELQPFLCSLADKPDVLIEWQEHPVLLIQVHSSPYINTVAKCVANVIDQLRILRCYYDVKKVSGYVFPKLHNKDGRYMNKTIVTRVDVQWEGLEFRVSFVHLPKLGVAEDVCKVFHHQWGTMKQGRLDTTTCESYFVRLSPEDLEQIQTTVESNSCMEQVPSKFSIITRDDKFYYKIQPEEANLCKVFYAYERLIFQHASKSFPSLVLPVDAVRVPGGCTVFMFKKQQEQPLSKALAKLCLGDLVRQVVHALQELHELGFAHLDVRLPNICFTHDGEVRLIDFDRAVYHNRKSVPAQLFGPYMYKCDPSLPVSALDWKQLGLMALCVLDPTMHQTKVNEEDVKQLCGDEFLHQLILKCHLDKDQMMQWTSKFSRTVREVLADRRK